MPPVIIKLNRPGVRELLRDPKTIDLENRTRRMAAAAGPGMEPDVSVGKERARGEVRTDTVDAMLAEAKTRDLTRAIDAAR